MKRITLYALSYLAATALLCHCTPAQPKQGFEVVKTEQGFEVLCDGKPTYITGVGGTNRLDIASTAGSNAFRTWGGTVQSVEADVELARQHNMYIMQGVWLTHDSASYHDEAYKNKIRSEVKALAERFKDEPRIMAWGLGNEIDHEEKANTAAAWAFVEELAQMVKSIDQRHLVATVITHNPRALEMIAKHVPTIDFVGINSYGDIKNLGKMLDNSTYQGPCMVTEWGPTGWWEMPKTEWGAEIEQTSEEKRVVYEERYTQHIKANPRCMGSFVFLWGQKEERTPTWFSMFVESDVEGLPLKGEKTPMVEAMQRVWTNAQLQQTAPVVELFTLNGKTATENVYVKPGVTFAAQVKATDKENNQLSYVWEVLKEGTELGSGGSYEPRPRRVGTVATTTTPSFTSAIKEPGTYRVYVYVLDSTGFVATANVPIKVQ